MTNIVEPYDRDRLTHAQLQAVKFYGRHIDYNHVVGFNMHTDLVFTHKNGEVMTINAHGRVY